MNRMVADFKQYDLCDQVIGAAMKVHSGLGPRFLESVYQNALIWELQKLGLKVDAQRPITVRYDGQVVGFFTADLLVNDSLIIELKANQLLAKAHEVQLVNYLVATGIDEGLLLNSGAERLEYKSKFRLPKQEQVSL
ncbi:MAG TPA: GxxExxY protein [Candidatus Udaeobacter sp.]